MDQALKGLDPTIAAERVASGSFTLENHWTSGEALNRIHAQKWNYMVLQDQSQEPVTTPAKFREYAAKLANEIRATGAGRSSS